MLDPQAAFERRATSRKLYLTGDRKEIAQTNLVVLRYASGLTLALLIVLLVAAFIVLDGWTPSPFHYAFIPVACILCVIAWLARRESSVRVATVLCVVYQVVLYTGVILIDTFGGQGAPSSFTQLVCVAMPALFVLPATLAYGLLALAEVAYTILVLTVKDPYIAQYDLFGMIAGVFFAVCVSQLVWEFHLKAFDLKMKFERLSKHDTLSNLYNKRAFFDQARTYLQGSNPNTTCSLAVIDLDDFKAVNDTFGHGKGDGVLSQAGTILLDLFRPSDLVARFGGDEYVVLVHNMIDRELIERRFTDFRLRLSELTRNDLGVSATCSIGIVCAENAEIDLDELFHQADKAMYEAKQAGKDRCVVKRYE